jgi:hypothetical protein
MKMLNLGRMDICGYNLGLGDIRKNIKGIGPGGRLIGIDRDEVSEIAE